MPRFRSPDGKHDTSNATITDLVAKFSMLSHQQKVPEPTRAYHIEILAEAAALEILCPIDCRRAIIQAEGQPTLERCETLAETWTIPLPYVVWAFSPEIMAGVAALLAE